MSAQLEEPTAVPGDSTPGPLEAAPDLVEVRRNAGVLGVVGALAAAVAIAWSARAADSGAVSDWALAGVTAVIAVLHLGAFVDARTPLLVADGQGVRLRRGRTWRGLPWTSLVTVQVEPRRNPLRDGHLTVVPHNPERVLDELGRPRSRFTGWVAGDPLSVPLGLATRVVGAPEGLPGALSALAGAHTSVVEVASDEASSVDPGTASTDGTEPENLGSEVEGRGDPVTHDAEAAPEPVERRWRLPSLRDPRPTFAAGIGAIAARLPGRGDEGHEGHEEEVELATEPDAEAPMPLVASAEPSPARETRHAVRADLSLADRTAGANALATDASDRDQSRELPELGELRRDGSVSLVEDTEVWGDRVRPIARPGDAVPGLVIEEVTEPAPDPVIGPELAAARTRLGLTVDQLADRTRVRPHVIESIEVDDFAPCGGDFYARGHLRTLCRVLGVEAAPLLSTYDERYGHAPISPRRVFESELASGTTIRATKGGLNWSLLVAVVMALVLAWSVARLVMDSPVDLQRVPGLGAGSGGLNQGGLATGDQIPVLLQAAAGGAHVVVRNGDGDIVFTGDLSYGATRSLKVAPPVRVESSDGGVEIVVDGVEKGRLGEPGEPASGTFIGR